jgi:hypothetical protein
MDQETLGEENVGKAGSKETRQRILKFKTKEPKRVKENIRGKHLRRKMWRKKLIAVDSYEEEPWEFIYTKLIVWKRVQKDLQMLLKKVLQLVMLQGGILF